PAARVVRFVRVVLLVRVVLTGASSSVAVRRVAVRCTWPAALRAVARPDRAAPGPAGPVWHDDAPPAPG
ncbi:hypothetical protein, partial [Kineococcus glutinatus]|uniref:hypothetical protein n=1 Tax=Kineococcus glutinatus TaxID=1070872 RepID=UPI0031EFC985